MINSSPTNCDNTGGPEKNYRLTGTLGTSIVLYTDKIQNVSSGLTGEEDNARKDRLEVLGYGE